MKSKILKFMLAATMCLLSTNVFAGYGMGVATGLAMGMAMQEEDDDKQSISIGAPVIIINICGNGMLDKGEHSLFCHPGNITITDYKCPKNTIEEIIWKNGNPDKLICAKKQPS